MSSEHPATTRAGWYRRTGQPYFSRTLQKEVRAWVKRRERKRAKEAGKTPPKDKGTDAGDLKTMA